MKNPRKHVEHTKKNIPNTTSRSERRLAGDVRPGFMCPRDSLTEDEKKPYNPTPSHSIAGAESSRHI